MATTAVLIDYVEKQIKRNDLTDRVVEAINAANIDIALTIKPHELDDLQTITTAVTDDTYALDSDALSIEFVVVYGISGNDVPQEIKEGSLRTFMMRNREDASNGVPGRWFRRANNIHIYDNIPDDNSGDNYTIEVAYVKRPTVIAASSPATVSDLNTEWDDMVKLLAAGKMFRFLQSPDLADTMFAEYNRILQSRMTPRAIQKGAYSSSGVEMG